jgi:hypothetical protein
MNESTSKEPVTTRRRLARGVTGISAILALLFSSLVIASPARADVAITVTPSTPTVGVPTTVAFTGAAPNSSVAITFAPSNFSAQPVDQVFASDSGTGSFTWIPALNGSVQITVTAVIPGGTPQSASSTVSVNPVTVVTTVNAPNVAAINQPINLVATVAPSAGGYRPTGTVQFAIQGGANIGGPVNLTNANPPTATLAWTPTGLGSVNIVATYSPARVSGVQPAVCNNACTSAPDNIVVTASGTAVGISVPPLFVGSPATLTATVFIPSYAGSVVFTANGAAIGAAVPVTAPGTASVTYTPTALGNVALAVTWTGNTGQTGTTSQTVAVQPAGGTDSITIEPVGATAAWSTTAPTTLPPATYVLGVQTASGATATLTEAGAGCSLSGTTFTVTGTSGTCTVTAASPGGRGFTPATVTFTLALTSGAQTARLAIPNSGFVRKGRTITLETANQGTTSAGETINWRVTRGASRCRLVYPSSGAVRLRKVRAGSCTVVGSAPATGNFGPFFISRTYR